MGRFKSRHIKSGADDYGGTSQSQVDTAAVPEGEFVLDETAGSGTVEGRNVGR